jgi:hypothetical protein
MMKGIAQLFLLVVIAASVVNMTGAAVDGDETKNQPSAITAIMLNDDIQTGDMDAQEHKYKYVVYYKNPHYKTKSYHKYQPYGGYSYDYGYQQPHYGGDYGISY